ncbi:hypothetical protein PROFUN_00591 [Planoprotostelium fungivorum]|uniref:Uncharacterized protein n=1 Tax=Planoprotostelium fungivorum TaxID=1890364 RepID=A0A2P6N1E3_9EUKA|nr:hypothetical protein PROFUN_00591 [Planoprotostelium fungivorum]
MFISTGHNTQTHKHLKLGISEKVGSHSLPNGTQTSDSKYKASGGGWVATGSGYSVSPQISREKSQWVHCEQIEMCCGNISTQPIHMQLPFTEKEFCIQILRPAETDLSWRLFQHSLCLDVKTRSRQGGDLSRPVSHARTAHAQFIVSVNWFLIGKSKGDSKWLQKKVCIFLFFLNGPISVLTTAVLLRHVDNNPSRPSLVHQSSSLQQGQKLGLLSSWEACHSSNGFCYHVILSLISSWRLVLLVHWMAVGKLVLLFVPMRQSALMVNTIGASQKDFTQDKQNQFILRGHTTGHMPRKGKERTYSPNSDPFNQIYNYKVLALSKYLLFHLSLVRRHLNTTRTHTKRRYSVTLSPTLVALLLASPSRAVTAAPGLVIV